MPLVLDLFSISICIYIFCLIFASSVSVVKYRFISNNYISFCFLSHLCLLMALDVFDAKWATEPKMFHQMYAELLSLYDYQ